MTLRNGEIIESYSRYTAIEILSVKFIYGTEV